MSFLPGPELPEWLRVELPFERRVHDDGGFKIHFIDHGQGRPVLLMHGNPTWCFLWRKVIAQLGEGYRVIAPDLYGFGLSDKPAALSAHTLHDHAARIAALVAALELKDLILVGQDWGGPIGAGLALFHPERIAAAVFGNTAILAPARPFRPSSFHRFAHTPFISDLAFRGLRFPSNVLHRIQGDPASIGKLEKKAYAYPHARFIDRAGPLALARMVPNREEHPTTAVMDRIAAWWSTFDKPMAFVWGLRDPILGRSLKRHIAAFPRARVTETQAGHFLQEEVPAEIADAIRFVAG